MWTNHKYRLLRIAMCCAVMAAPLGMRAKDMVVAVDVQWSLLCKVLTFDRNFSTETSNPVVVGIVYQSRYRVSLDIKNELMDNIENTDGGEIAGRKVVAVPIDFTSGLDVEAAVANAGLTIAYVAPLRGVNLHDIAASFGRYNVLTVTGVDQYVDDGVAVGIVEQGGYPHIKLNLAAAKSAGADFSSQLFKVATVINP